jgi:hypothetical protein
MKFFEVNVRRLKEMIKELRPDMTPILVVSLDHNEPLMK